MKPKVGSKLSMLHFRVKHSFGVDNREIQYSWNISFALNAKFNTRQTRFLGLSPVKLNSHEI